MRVTGKGQVTPPKDVRDKLGIGPGSEVDFVESEGAVLLVSVGDQEAQGRRAAAVLAWADRVAGTIDLDGMTTDEFIADLRGPRDDLSPC